MCFRLLTIFYVLSLIYSCQTGKVLRLLCSTQLQMCYKFTFPYRYPMLQHWKWPGNIVSQTNLSKIEPNYRKRKLWSFKRFKSWFTLFCGIWFWSPQHGRNQRLSSQDLLSRQPNGMSLCHWQRAQLPSHNQSQVAKENKKHGRHRPLQMGNCWVCKS